MPSRYVYPCPFDHAPTHFSQTLTTVVSFDVISKSILPMMDKLVIDAIPNIRFNVAKSYAELINVLKRLPSEGTVYSLEKAGATLPPSSIGLDLIHERIIPNLDKLQKDDDVDVRFFATTAANLVSGDPMAMSP